jgi:hypothetical protein
LVDGATFEWEVNGDVLFHYAVFTNEAHAVPLADDNPMAGGSGETFHYGKKQRSIRFFWVSTSDPGPDLQDVKVTATVPGAVVKPRDTKYRVYSPESTLTATMGEAQFINQDPNLNGEDVLGLLPAGASQAGMHFTGNVQLPGAFAGQVGYWNFLQLGTPSTTLVEAGGAIWKNQWFANEGLDDWPYSVPAEFNDPYDALGGSAYAAGSGPKRQSDDPHTHLPHNNPVFLDVKRNDSFKTYIMFRPPGADTEWVPLRIMNWSWHGHMVRQNANQLFVEGPNGLGESKDESERTGEHPEWTHRINPDQVKKQ